MSRPADRTTLEAILVNPVKRHTHERRLLFCSVLVLAVCVCLAESGSVAGDSISSLAEIGEEANGSSLGLIIVLAASTLVSEDLTCIAAGVLVAQGEIGYGLGVFACCLGIFVGDVLLFLAGRILGRPALSRAPLRWFVRREDVDRSSLWFNRRGLAVIATSRFVPGMRLPTYFAAGLLNTDLIRFSIYFLIAAMVWTPLLVGLSSLLGAEAIKSALLEGRNALVQAIAGAVVALVIVKLAVRMSTHRGRRLLVSSWRKVTRWEFWPLWVFYVPVVLYILRLSTRHGGLTVFTAANPSIPASGLIGESKIDILRGLSKSGRYVARGTLIEAERSREEKLATALGFMKDNAFTYPIVLKPDMGQRGSGVAVVRSTSELDQYLTGASANTIVQEYVPGCEFGVFYYRRPDEPRGRIFSVTEKRFPEVVGDGVKNFERLILDDQRAVCMARLHLDKHSERLRDIPAAGERVQLVEIGTHCRGAVFLDGGWVMTQELEDRIDEISRGFDGFYFGRYDIRASSVEDLKAGRIKVIELNGVTSEATNIYDPGNSLFAAYRVLFKQWGLAFEIGARNRELGVKPATVRESVKMILDYQRRATAQAS